MQSLWAVLRSVRIGVRAAEKLTQRNVRDYPIRCAPAGERGRFLTFGQPSYANACEMQTVTRIASQESSEDWPSGRSDSLENWPGDRR
jgi:hypothetical protein